MPSVPSRAKVLVHLNLVTPSISSWIILRTLRSSLRLARYRSVDSPSTTTKTGTTSGALQSIGYFARILRTDIYLPPLNALVSSLYLV